MFMVAKHSALTRISELCVRPCDNLAPGAVAVRHDGKGIGEESTERVAD